MFRKLGLILCGAIAGIALVLSCEVPKLISGDAGVEDRPIKIGAGSDALAAPSDCPNGWTVTSQRWNTGITTSLVTKTGEEPFAIGGNGASYYDIFVRSCTP